MNGTPIRKILQSFGTPGSLRFQLISRTLFILAALFLLIGILQSYIMKDFLYRNQADTIEAHMRSLPRDLFMHGGMSNRGGMPPKDRFFFLPDTSLAFIGPDGAFLDLSTQNGNLAPRLSDEAYQTYRDRIGKRGGRDYEIARDENGVEQLIVVRAVGSLGSSGILIQMGAHTDPLKDIANRQLFTFGILALLAIAGGLALYLPVLRRTLHPLQQMIHTVERIDAGNLAERAPSNQGQQEIDRLAESFNGMLERLEHSFETEREAKEQMRRFIADASHELRTPLTSINGFLEVLLRGAAERPEQLRASLSSMHGESKRMTKLVEDLLLLAKLDRAPRLSLSETELDRVILDMEHQLRVLGGKRDVTFDLAPGLPTLIDVDKFKQVVLNLFHNAVQHTVPEEGAIELRLTAKDGYARLQVRDNGTGIAEDHLPHLFERFYRIDNSRTRKHGGAGLGLSISQSIVEAHGGSIRAADAPGGGALFEVVLPLK